MNISYSNKSLTKQEVTTCTISKKDGVVLRGSKKNKYFGRYVSVDTIFDTITIDGIQHYNFKNINDHVLWFTDDKLLKLYKYNSIFMDLFFRTSKLPKRCEPTLKEYTNLLTNHLRSTKERVSQSKVKMVVKHILKHVSRLHYHNVFTLTYSRHASNWSDNKTLSCEYMLEFIDLLVSRDEVVTFSGSKDLNGNGSTISSMLVFNPAFIKECNGVEVPLQMEECLKVREDKPLVKIHVDSGKSKTKKPRRITGQEKIELSPIMQVLIHYREMLNNEVIRVNGVSCPELQYTMVFNESLYYGGRLYDNGYIQSQSQSIRGTITIGGENTVEKDYSGLHYAIACEEMGIQVEGDPYDFPVDGIVVDTNAILNWKQKHSITLKYDPVRNIKKTALLVMFNASDKQSAIRGIRDALFRDMKRPDKLRQRFIGIKSCDTRLLVEAIIQYRGVVHSYFCSGVGRRFQNLDSKMMLYCINKFAEIGEVCLPVHDSLVVKESLSGYTDRIMEDAYEAVMGSKMNCKIK